jgi:hypothetical protein
VGSVIPIKTAWISSRDKVTNGWEYMVAVDIAKARQEALKRLTEGLDLPVEVIGFPACDSSVPVMDAEEFTRAMEMVCDLLLEKHIYPELKKLGVKNIENIRMAYGCDKCETPQTGPDSIPDRLKKKGK